MRSLRSNLSVAISSAAALGLSTGLALAGCSAGPRPAGEDGPNDEGAAAAAEAEERVGRLAQHLAGRFDSSAQAARDRSYFGVSLRACPFALEELGAHVLYVEQAMVDTLDAPYRQRVYVLSATDEQGAKSEVHELTDPAKFVGFCDDAGIAAPTANDLILKEGCAVHLREEGDTFVGGTEGNGCASTRQGATYATSEVTITPVQIRSWDRGYNAEDAQVWGAQAGPYEFDRKQ